MNGYFAYYLAWILLSYALSSPWLLAGLVVLVVLHRFVPGPGPLLRMFGRARRLRAQVEVNRANITARRDLAEIYLDGLRPRAAIKLLEEGLTLSPNDAELLYLMGLALHRAGRHEKALTPLVRAVEVDPRIRYGLPYSVAADALAALSRWDGALDACERYLLGNSSDVSVYTRLARAQARTGDHAAAHKTLLEGLNTWSVLPGSMKRRQFRYFLGAQWARVTVLKQPFPILLLLASCGLVSFGVWHLYGPVMKWFREPWSLASGDVDPRLYDGFRRCGSQSTGDFVGKYRVIEPAAAVAVGSASATANTAPQRSGPEEKDSQHGLLEEFANFEIRNDRIVSGTRPLIQEFCLTRVTERTPTLLVTQAVWHEDVDDPGDASMVTLRLNRRDDQLAMTLVPFDDDNDEPWVINFRRE
ncbi:MAG TPA: tetratricopeptide repeat protein [Polyangiaceae bacterium]|nr:tetratricopeptide repeat protein [Polyangiaceae bacterium]